MILRGAASVAPGLRLALSVLAALVFSGRQARAQTGTATPAPSATPATPAPSAPSATPFPDQDAPPAGLPPDYDEAIRVPGAITSTAGGIVPVENEPIPAPENKRDDVWNPRQIFPGNYWALPVTADFSFRPCLECHGIPSSTPFLQRPGELSLWLGYAFQALPRVSSPFMAGGVDWIFYENREGGGHDHRNQLMPAWRVGWNWGISNLYGSAGVIIPGEDRERIGWHAGIGGSSAGVLVLAACVGEAIPSVVELGYDWLPPEKLTGASRNRFALKLGWGF